MYYILAATISTNSKMGNAQDLVPRVERKPAGSNSGAEVKFPQH